jgi:hypothetical protein
MKRTHGITQTRILRWITAAAVLFYVLVPQVGVCRCSDCDCCHDSRPSEIAEVPSAHSCCVSNKVTAEVTVSDDCCSKKTDDNKSDSCPCRIKNSDAPTALWQPKVFLHQISEQFSEDLKKLSYPASTFSFPSKAFAEFVSWHKTFESPTSRLPVRLHLLLLVLLN